MLILDYKVWKWRKQYKMKRMKAVRIGTILMLLSGSLLVNSSVYAQEKEPIQDVSEKIAVKATNEAKTFEEWFEDRDLSSSVAHVFGKNRTDTITQAELARVTELPVGEGFGLSGVTSFKGIEHLTNLTRLYVHYNSTLQDLTPLAKAKNLEYLELSCRALEDISPLANLPNLTTLYLEDTLVEDITPLANITTLNTLGIYETRNYRDEHGLVSDLTPLQNLSELRRLTIYRQSVKELPEGFSQLNLYSLDMSDNVIQDIGMLQGMKKFVHFGFVSQPDRRCDSITRFSKYKISGFDVQQDKRRDTIARVGEAVFVKNL